MKKLDKDTILATGYKEWLDKLEEDNKAHPVYNSANKYYKDVVANLLWLQKGVCAYTEQFLFDYVEVSPDNWIDGRYNKDEFEFFGHLEHYDESLKQEKGWLWSNLFVVHSDINTKRKGSKPVKHALKPDAANYDPFYLLEYNFREHKFLPNSEREFDLQRSIKHDIDVLGLNYQSLVQSRKNQLNTLVEEIRLNKKTAEEAKASLREYFTAFEMIVQTLQLQG